jgi:pyrroloquinoline quinone biosynthesis protein E
MRPRLAAKARVRRDPRDGAAVLLSPERGLRLNETSAAILALCDGTRTIAQIVDTLSARFAGADRARIERDVRTMLEDLYRRALLEGVEWGSRLQAPDSGSELQTFPPSGCAGRIADESDSGPIAGDSNAGPTPDDSSPAPDAAASETSTPYTLVAELTHRCPLACPYCSNPRELVRAHDELRTEEWLRVLEEAAALGVMQMHLTGGEPLARSDLEAIASRAHALDLYVNLVTSGVPLERGRLEGLAPSLDHVQLSLQDADRACSDRIAGTVSFDAKLRVARWVKELGLPLTLNVVLHRANLDRVEAVVALAEELAVDRLELANVQFVSWAHANVDGLLPTRSQIEHARSVAQAARRRLEGRMEVVFVLPDWHADRPRACMDGWGRRFVVVAPDGTVLPCHGARALPLAFEGVRAGALVAAWKDAPGMRAFRGESWMPDPCRGCDRRAIDFGGCRCQAFALTGDLRATDPACGLAPHHGIVRAAREAAERAAQAGQAGQPGAGSPASSRTWLYRGRARGFVLDE